MSDWMSGPHAVRHSTAEPQPEPDPVEVTEPVDVVAWLRALPVGTVLLDSDNDAWQILPMIITPHRAPSYTRIAFTCAAESWTWPSDLRDRDDDEQCAQMAEYGPFRVLWMPPVGGAS